MSLPVTVAFPAEVERRWNALQDTSSGVVRGGEITPRVDDTYSVRYPHLTAAQRDAIQALHDAQTTFSWTHPVDGTLTVRFADDELVFRRNSFASWSVEFDLEVE